jgi:hypothetical protein
MTERSEERKPVRARGRKDRREIDENLRRVYEGMVDDSVPDRFLELLQKLREEGNDR